MALNHKASQLRVRAWPGAEAIDVEVEFIVGDGVTRVTAQLSVDGAESLSETLNKAINYAMPKGNEPYIWECV